MDGSWAHFHTHGIADAECFNLKISRYYFGAIRTPESEQHDHIGSMSGLSPS